MAVTLQDLIALLPLLIIGLAVMTVIFSIAWRRNHFLNATPSVVGLNATLVSLWFIGRTGATDITSLMRVDGFTTLYTGSVLLANSAAYTFAYPWLEGYNDNKGEFYPLVLIAALSGVLLANVNRPAFLSPGIKLTFLPLFGPIGYTFRQKCSLEASIRCITLSATVSSFLLFDMALMYTQSGDLSSVALNKNLGDGMLNEPLLLTDFGLMIVDLGLKLSLVPFHLWTLDIYQGAPAPVSAFLATASKIAIFGVMMRLFLYVPVSDSGTVRVVLTIITFASITFGNLMAPSQTSIKHLLGYLSTSRLDHLLVVLVALQTDEMSMEAVGVHLIGYLFSSLGTFGVVSLMPSPYRGPDAGSLFSYRGLFWHRPILTAVMMVIMLSLAGILVTLGFIGKFYVLTVGVQAHLWWPMDVVVAGSAIGFYYYLRVVMNLYLHAPEQPDRDAPPNWQYSAGGIVVLISALLVLMLGVWPQPLIGIVRLAVPLT